MDQTLKFIYAIIFFFSLCLVITHGGKALFYFCFYIHNYSFPFTNIPLFLLYMAEFHSCIHDDDCPYDYCTPPKYSKCIWSSCYCKDFNE
ncbi:unnamed protein product [Trifolium pratense]|uniref:Uncharacterized protein n=1 Tax=Trifolium pratense TaxID=57577 RepID=A0ACB0LNP2_TRIPR|nr:unnamed protein product [Trifolium pratense]